MKIALITDQHFGCRADNVSFLDYYEEFYSRIFFPELEKRKIKTVIDLGDTFDRRKYVNYNTLKRTKEMWFDVLRNSGIELHSIVGNHTTFYKNTNDVNSLDLLVSEYDNVYNMYPEYKRLTDIDSESILAIYSSKGLVGVNDYIQALKNPNALMIMDKNKIHISRNKNGHPIFIFDNDGVVYFSSIKINKNYKLFNNGVKTYEYT